MSEDQYGGGFGRNRGGGGFGGPRRRADGGQDFSAGTPWDSRNRDRGYGSGDIVQQELDRPQRAFEYVQRYPGGYGGQPMGGGGRGGRGPTKPQEPTGGGFGGGDDNRFDRLIGALEKGWGGSSSSASTSPISNTFNPVFNPTISMTGPNTQVAGGDIRESPISTETVTTGGGPNTAGRDINQSGGGDVDTGAGGGNNVVDAGPKSIIEEVDTFTGTDTTPPPTNTGGGVLLTPDPNTQVLDGEDDPIDVGPDPTQTVDKTPPADDFVPHGHPDPTMEEEVTPVDDLDDFKKENKLGEYALKDDSNKLTIDSGSFLRDQLIKTTDEQSAGTTQNLDNAGLTFIDPFAKEGETKGERHANILFQPGKGSGAGGFVGGQKGVIDTDFEGAIDISGYPGLSPASAKTEDFLGGLDGTGGGTQNANTTVNANTSATTGDNTMTAGGDIIGSTQDNTAIATGGLNIAGGNVNQSGGGDISTVGGGGNVVNANLGNQSGGQNLSATTDLPSAYDLLSDNEKYITDLYVKGLNRAPEAEGMEYFLDELESGSLDKGSSLDASILGSAEAQVKDAEGVTEGVYQSIDDYMAGGGKGGNPFLSNYVQTTSPDSRFESTKLDTPTFQGSDVSDPSSPFYVDPNFNFEDEIAKLTSAPNNPFAEQNAQLQQQQEQEETQTQEKEELIPFSTADLNDPNWMFKNYDFSK